MDLFGYFQPEWSTELFLSYSPCADLPENIYVEEVWSGGNISRTISLVNVWNFSNVGHRVDLHSYLIFKTMVAIAIFAKGTSVRSYNALTFSPRI